MFRHGIVVIGLGYIGLPTCAAIAARGYRSPGWTTTRAPSPRSTRVGRRCSSRISGSPSPAPCQGLLTATTEVPTADAFIIAVPTPFIDDHRPDLSYVGPRPHRSLPRLRGGELVILESTSPPGTTGRSAGGSPRRAPTSPSRTSPACPTSTSRTAPSGCSRAAS